MLTAVCLLPVRVEGRLAAYRHDQVDVAVGVLVQNIGFNGPAGLIITCTQAIQCPYLWELLFWVGVPVTSQLDLHLLLFIRHGRGLDIDHQVAVGQVLHAVDLHALWQAFNIRVLGVQRGAGGRFLRREVIGQAGFAAGCGREIAYRRLCGGVWQQGQTHGDGGRYCGHSKALASLARGSAFAHR